MAHLDFGRAPCCLLLKTYSSGEAHTTLVFDPGVNMLGDCMSTAERRADLTARYDIFICVQRKHLRELVGP